MKVDGVILFLVENEIIATPFSLLLPARQVKYCVLLCGDDEDMDVVKAAAGALAMLTSQSNKICKKIFDVSVL